MKRIDELKSAISDKRSKLITAKNSAKNAEDFATVKQLTTELNQLLDELETETTLEETELQNFLKNASPLDAPLNASKFSGGVPGREYHKDFFNQVRAKFKNAGGYLREGTPAQGGYLVPCEFHDAVITALKSENVLRQISRVVTTANDRQIAIQTTAPTAAFVAEGQTIPLSTNEFDRKTLGAFKIAAGVSVSNELLADSFYNIEEHLLTEFTRAIAATEEAAFLNGTGNGEPLGILPQLAADSSTTITTAGASIAADDIINLAHSLKRPYRKNAVFIANDSTIAAIRKLKDNNQQYLWQQNITAGEPPLLFGYPVYSSEFLPEIASGKIAVLFGDFRRFIVGQRGEMTFKPLRELHALQDLSTFLLIERVDGVIADSQAIRGLKVQ